MFKKAPITSCNNLRSSAFNKCIVQQQPRQIKQIQRKDDRMSLQKDDKSNSNNQLKMIIHQGILTEKYHFLLQNAVASDPLQPEILDPKLIYMSNLTTIQGGKNKKMLVFKQSEYILSNWQGDGWPNVIYIALDNMNGYLNKKKEVTARVAALQLQQICPVLDDSQVRVYDLRYVLRDPVVWNLPQSMNTLRFRIILDEQLTATTLPLPQPMTLNFEIRIQ